MTKEPRGIPAEVWKEEADAIRRRPPDVRELLEALKPLANAATGFSLNSDPTLLVEVELQHAWAAQRALAGVVTTFKQDLKVQLIEEIEGAVWGNLTEGEIREIAEKDSLDYGEQEVRHVEWVIREALRILTAHGFTITRPGDRRLVRKASGYKFEGVCVATFQTLAGKTRHVVDNGDGLLHIFSPEQLEFLSPAPTAGEVVDRNAIVEECAKVVEEFGKPWALNTATGAMMFRAEVDKIATAIRALTART